MNRSKLLPVALFAVAAAILGVGAWLWLGMASDQDPQTAKNTSTATDAGSPTSTDKLAEKRVAIPDCPAALVLDRSFREVPVRASRPALRVHSQRRLVRIDADCRTTSADTFDPDQFLQDIYRGMELKHKEAVRGRTSLEMNDGQVVGSSIEIRGGRKARKSRKRKERVTYNNVLIRDRTIVVLKVGGPVGEVTRIFNEKLLEKGVVWSD